MQKLREEKRRPCVATCSASSIRGIKNFGDELLTDLYGRWIKQSRPDIDVHHLSISYFGTLLPESLKAIVSASFLVFTGGGYFADGVTRSKYSLRRHLKALRNRNVYWTVFRLARRNRVPCAVMGLEVGPLVNPLYRYSVREILLASRCVVVRNEKSRWNVEALCGNSVIVTVHMDAALTATAAEVGIGLRGSIDQSGRSRTSMVHIGIHVNHIETSRSAAAYMELVREILHQTPKCKETRLHFIYDQRKMGRHPYNAVKAEAMFRATFPSLNVIPYEGPQKTVGALGEMDLVLTDKLHVGVVARGLGVPVLALGRHPKIRRFYKALGEVEFCGYPEDFLRDGIPQRALMSVRSEKPTALPIHEWPRRSAIRNQEAVQKVVLTALQSDVN